MKCSTKQHSIWKWHDIIQYIAKYRIQWNTISFRVMLQYNTILYYNTILQWKYNAMIFYVEFPVWFSWSCLPVQITSHPTVHENELHTPRPYTSVAAMERLQIVDFKSNTESTKSPTKLIKTKEQSEINKKIEEDKQKTELAEKASSKHFVFLYRFSALLYHYFVLFLIFFQSIWQLKEHSPIYFYQQSSTSYSCSSNMAFASLWTNHNTVVLFL